MCPKPGIAKPVPMSSPVVVKGFSPEVTALGVSWQLRCGRIIGLRLIFSCSLFEICAWISNVFAAFRSHKIVTLSTIETSSWRKTARFHVVHTVTGHQSNTLDNQCGATITSSSASGASLSLCKRAEEGIQLEIV